MGGCCGSIGFEWLWLWDDAFNVILRRILMNERTIQEFESKHREMWLDFETWLYKNYKLTIPNLSWNEYIEYSKTYNGERKNA